MEHMKNEPQPTAPRPITPAKWRGEVDFKTHDLKITRDDENGRLYYEDVIKYRVYRERVQAVARKARKTKDTRYNKGKKDCAEGRFDTPEAKYFIGCEGL